MKEALQRTLCFLWVCLAFAGASASQESGAPEAFGEILAALGKRTDKTFIFDGRPLDRVAVTPEKRAILASGSLRDCLVTLEEALDVTCQERGDFVLAARNYANPTDAPSVTPQECYIASARLVRELAPFNPVFSKRTGLCDDPLTRDLMYSLTPRQLTLMRSGQRTEGSIIGAISREQALPASSLTEAQKKAVARLAAYFYVDGAYTAARELHYYLNALKDGSILFRSEKAGNYAVYGMEARPKAGTTSRFFPLDTLDGVGSGGLVGDIPVRPIFLRTNGLFKEDEETAGEPSARERFAGRKSLSDYLASPVESAFIPRTDGDLGEKEVYIVGGKAAQDEIWRNVSRLYGLHFRTQTDGVRVITYPRAYTPGSMGDLRSLMVKSYPKPLLQLLYGKGRDFSRQVRHDLIRRIRSLTERKAAVKSPRTLKLAETGEDRPRIAALVAALLMTDLWGHFSYIAESPTPLWVSRPEQVYLTGGLYETEGGKFFSLFLATPRAGTETLDVTGGGMSGIPFDKARARPE